jgi:hypothetical protein
MQIVTGNFSFEILDECHKSLRIRGFGRISLHELQFGNFCEKLSSNAVFDAAGERLAVAGFRKLRCDRVWQG